MTLLDVICLMLLVGGAALGAWSGALKSVSRMVATFVAYFIASLSTLKAAAWLEPQFMSMQMMIKPIVGAFVFGLSLFVCLVLASAFRKMGEENSYEWPNRLLGAVLGATKGLVIVWLAMGILYSFPDVGTVKSIKEETKFFQSYVEHGGTGLVGDAKRGVDAVNSPDSTANSKRIRE
jgi:uncharacterized membrane protein required for colicin V production